MGKYDKLISVISVFEANVVFVTNENRLFLTKYYLLISQKRGHLSDLHRIMKMWCLIFGYADSIRSQHFLRSQPNHHPPRIWALQSFREISSPMMTDKGMQKTSWIYQFTWYISSYYLNFLPLCSWITEWRHLFWSIIPITRFCI